MDDLHKLREMLCHELKEYSNKGVSSGTLDVVDKLTHAIKNLDKIIESGDYSESYYPIEMRYPRRYSRDYSRDHGMVKELRGLMESAPDERTRQEFARFISKLETM